MFGTSYDQGSEDRLFYARVVILSITPFLFLLLTSAVWILLSFLTKSTSKNIGSYIFGSLVVMYFIYCPTVVYLALQNLNCADVYGDGYRLRLDMDQLCFQGKHLTYVIVLTIPTLILWVYLLPYLFNRYLKKNSHVLNQIKSVEEVTTYEKSQIRIFRLKFSFFMEGFKFTEYNWQALIEYKKILLCLFAVLATRHSNVHT